MCRHILPILVQPFSFIFHVACDPVMFCWQFENGTFAHSFNTNGIIYIHRSFHLNALYTRIYVVFIIYTPDHTAFPASPQIPFDFDG